MASASGKVPLFVGLMGSFTLIPVDMGPVRRSGYTGGRNLLAVV